MLIALGDKEAPLTGWKRPVQTTHHLGEHSRNSLRFTNGNGHMTEHLNLESFRYNSILYQQPPVKKLSKQLLGAAPRCRAGTVLAALAWVSRCGRSTWRRDSLPIGSAF